jgi:RND family efflux transporter MFP subunit
MSQPVSHEDTLPSATATDRTGSKLRLPMLVGAILIGGAFIVGARHYQRADPPTEPPAPGMKVGKDSVTLTSDAPAWNVIKLGAPEVAGPHWTDAIPAHVAFDEAKTSRLGSPLAGRITAVMVERGEHVKSGKPLFTVSSSGLAELRSELAKANIERATAHANLDRTQALVDAGSVPAKELILAKQEVNEAELAVKLAEQKLSALRVSGSGESAFTITAPRDGIVVEKNIAPGQQVDATTGSLMAIADLSEVWIVADIFEADVGNLAPGTKAKVTAGTVEREGVIDHVSGIVDPDRHTVPVRVRLANTDGALRPNAYTTVRFYDPTTAKVALPSAAVMSDGAKSYVYVKQAGGELKRKDITVGSASEGKVPVLAGLEPTDQVVLRGAILLDNQIQLDN